LSPLDVSRETSERLACLVAELQRWQAIKNLVGRGTLDQIWTRHIEDSLQLYAYRGNASTWLDLGSGAGFPGLVLAIAGRDSGLSVTLVESNARKCAFLRHIARLTDTPVTIHERRLEEVIPESIGSTDIVSARALASLPQLLEWTAPLLRKGTIGLFPKGRGLQSELTEARKTWTFGADILPSMTDSEAGILRITSFEIPT
jgi:16S rRNA (guanine527-N7)-methyltransferase